MLPKEKWKKAWEWKKLLAEKKTSPKEICEEYLKRAEQDKTNAFIKLTPEWARGVAQSVSQDSQDVMSGIPIGLKDNLVTKGIETTCGSKILQNYKPPYDGTVVKKLKDLQAVVIGKCNLDEFAMGSSNENSAYGSVSLPQKENYVPGGSSGGSAAAVAGGLVVHALGSDTGGSVRQPASFCGVVGLKPTYGRVSRYGLVAFASSLDQIGPLALDVQDCADMYDSIAGYDPLDSTSANRKNESCGLRVREVRESKSKRDEKLKSLTVGLPKEFFGEGLSDDVRASIDACIQKMRAKGVKFKEVSLPHSKFALPVYYVVAVSEASTNLSRYDGVRFGPRILPHENKTTLEEMYSATRGALFGPEVKRRILLGTFALSSGYYDAYYKKACQVRNLISQDFIRTFHDVDVILGPTTPTVSFEKGAKSNDPLSMYLSDIYTVPVNLAGVPAVSIPSGLGNHQLPVGLQIIGPSFSEPELLSAAATIESLLEE
ncbi:MAG: Asp-tRNA(Asn)/Glu-tRNA(Gln) amidotransferase subunit GatA [Oligoflexia bacterium]|nr:Asp-tRNA(Asn)/Glu-tRNA(Gln) amidotransferase subunit GatA [Oligoflexia bacterium]